MIPVRSRSRVFPTLRLVAAIVAAWASIGLAGVADASPTRPNHHCPCESRCRGVSCCCPDDAAPAETPAPAANATAASTRPIPASGPCLGQIPCGGGELPNAPPGTSAPKAAIGPCGLLNEPDSGDTVEFPRHSLDEATTASRLDDPPERAA
jgi:hypothetical protein